MYDALLAKLDRLEYLHDNNLPVDVSLKSVTIKCDTPLTIEQLRDASYQYKDITQQQVDQQGPYVHHSDDGVPVPCSERVVALSQIMNTSYQFADEHRGKRKAEEEAEGQPGAKRQGLLGLDDDAPRRTSALMSAHDDVAEGGRSATPGEEQQDAARKPTKPGRARGGAGAKQTLTASNGPVIEDKDEELLDVEEVNGLPLPKGASLPDEHGVRIITKSRKVEYANNRIMAPVASPFDDYQIGYRDSSNNPLKGATRARRREYLGQANSNAAFYDRRVANYNSVLQKEEDYDQQLVEKHNLHPTLGIFMPNSVNMSESSARKDLQEYKPVVQVGPNGQIFHASRSVPRHRLEQEAERIEQRLKLKAALSEFLAQEGIPEEEVAPSPEILQQHREAVLAAFDIDPATLTAAKETSTASQSPEAVQGDEHEAAKEPQRGIEELLQAARQVESEENASRMARNTASHKSSRPYDAIRDVFTENSPVVPAAHAPAPAAEALADNTYNLSFLAEIAENPDRAERMRQEEMRWAEIHRAERAAEAAEREHHFAMAEAFREDQAAHGQAQAEVSVMDPRLFPPHDVPHGNMHMAAAEAPQPQYPDHPHPHQYHSHDPASQWQREGTSVQSAGPPRGNDFLRTALNPQTPPPPTYPPPSYPPPPDYQVPLLGPAPPTQAPGTPFHSVAPQRGSLPALRPVRTSFDDGALAPEYQGSPGPAHRPSMVASNSGVYYPPAPPRPYHNGYMVEEQQMHPQQHHVGPPPHHQSMHPMAPTPAPYPQSPDNNGYGYPPLAPAPAAAAYQSPGAYSPIAQHPMTPVQAAGRGQPGGSSRPYRKLEPAPAQSANKPRAGAQRPELRTVQFDYREGIKDYVPLEPPPVHGPSSIRGWSHQNLKQRRASKEVPAPAPTDEPS